MLSTPCDTESGSLMRDSYEMLEQVEVSKASIPILPPLLKEEADLYTCQILKMEGPEVGFSGNLGSASTGFIEKTLSLSASDVNNVLTSVAATSHLEGSHHGCSTVNQVTLSQTVTDASNHNTNETCCTSEVELGDNVGGGEQNDVTSEGSIGTSEASAEVGLVPSATAGMPPGSDSSSAVTAVSPVSSTAAWPKQASGLSTTMPPSRKSLWWPSSQSRSVQDLLSLRSPQQQENDRSALAGGSSGKGRKSIFLRSKRDQRVKSGQAFAGGVLTRAVSHRGQGGSWRIGVRNSSTLSRNPSPSSETTRPNKRGASRLFRRVLLGSSESMPLVNFSSPSSTNSLTPKVGSQDGRSESGATATQGAQGVSVSLWQSPASTASVLGDTHSSHWSPSRRWDEGFSEASVGGGSLFGGRDAQASASKRWEEDRSGSSAFGREAQVSTSRRWEDDRSVSSRGGHVSTSKRWEGAQPTISRRWEDSRSILSAVRQEAQVSSSMRWEPSRRWVEEEEEEDGSHSSALAEACGMPALVDDASVGSGSSLHGRGVSEPVQELDKVVHLQEEARRNQQQQQQQQQQQRQHQQPQQHQQQGSQGQRPQQQPQRQQAQKHQQQPPPLFHRHHLSVSKHSPSNSPRRILQRGRASLLASMNHLSTSSLSPARASHILNKIPRAPTRGGHPPSGGTQKAPQWSPLELLLTQGGTMKEHLGKFLLDPEKLEVGELLASGSSGEVRRGRYEGQEVAIKILNGDTSGGAPEEVTRSTRGGRAHQVHSSSLLLRAEFRREVLGLLSSHEFPGEHCPQVLRLVGVCVDARQRLCIVTEYMPGGTLYELLLKARKQSNPQGLLLPHRLGLGAGQLTKQEQSGSQTTQQGQGRYTTMALPEERLLGIATDVAKALFFLHKHGIIHRDLKSANVFLGPQGAVVGDLGVAKLKGEGGEMTKEVGTYRWMAPEAFGTSAWPVTPKSDVYSFGVLLWEMVTGEIPYEGYTPVQAAVAVALSGLRPQIPEYCPPRLAALIEQCWDKDPEKRPSFDKVLARLQAMKSPKV